MAIGHHALSERIDHVAGGVPFEPGASARVANPFVDVDATATPDPDAPGVAWPETCLEPGHVRLDEEPPEPMLPGGTLRSPTTSSILSAASRSRAASG